MHPGLDRRNEKCLAGVLAGTIAAFEAFIGLRDFQTCFAETMSTLKRAYSRFLGSILLGLLVAGGMPGALYGQATEDNPIGQLQNQFEADTTLPSSSAELVSVEPRLARTPVPAGTGVPAALVLDVEDGWHVNAHRPTYDYLIGTQLDWDVPSDVRIERTKYPEPKRYHLKFAADTIDVYDGRAPIFATVRPAASAEPGDRRLTGRLRVQACNDRTCLRPSTIEVSLPITVAGVGTKTQSTNDPIFEGLSRGTDRGVVMGVLRQHGLFLAGGLLVLLTLGGLVVYGRWVETEDGRPTDASG